jgi:Protein of unknown function (DUF1822)
MNSNNISNFTIPLDRTAHEWAAKFASDQTSTAKGKQVYLNTLAVWAVRQYLSWTCQLDLDLSQGDSWQIELQSIMNVADLVIPGVGKLECVPVLPSVTEIQLSPLIDDRIGYVMVQFSENLNSVQLLGFVSQSTVEVISIDQIQDLEELLDLIYLDRVNNLSKFLAGMLGIGWEPIEKSLEIDEIDTAAHREFALRNAISQLNSPSYDSIQGFTASKTINLRAKIASIPLLLLIGLSQESDGQIKVKIRLHSGGGITVLPANIELILQAPNGDRLSEVQYPRGMNFIQLQSFKLQPGTEFKIQVALGEDNFIESFVA